MSEIPIGGREARVAELSLDETRWQPLGCQLRCVGVAEAVRVDALLDSDDKRRRIKGLDPASCPTLNRAVLFPLLHRCYIRASHGRATPA